MTPRLDALGWDVVPGVPEPVADRWAAAILDAVMDGAGARIDRPGNGLERFLDEGGPYHHWTLDTDALSDAIPDVQDWYAHKVSELTEYWHRPVIVSPYHRSALTGKVYGRAGDCQGWHRDTNPVTALLCLTGVDGDWGTNLVQRDGVLVQVRTRPGDLVVFYGRELRHFVPRFPEGEEARVTIPANYYHPDDQWRPDGIDDLVYGGE